MTQPSALAASAPEPTLRAAACAMGMMMAIITRTGRRRASA
jgi:hypothetical protein